MDGSYICAHKSLDYSNAKYSFYSPYPSYPLLYRNKKESIVRKERILQDAQEFRRAGPNTTRPCWECSYYGSGNWKYCWKCRGESLD